MIHLRKKLALAAALMFISAMAYAHRFHAGISDISMNAQTGSIEIVHTFMAHDVEQMLENLYQRQFDLSDDDDALLFRRYVEKQFAIANANGETLPLKWVGMKVDPTSVIVFQEVVKQTIPENALIHNAVLTDFLVDQVNTINVTVHGKIQSLTLTRSKREQNIE
jgi:urocanate hydratase